MDTLTRKQMEALTRLFNRFALSDQRNYYSGVLRRNRKSASQVNGIRATFALFAGLASVLAGFMVATWFDSSGLCGTGAQEQASIVVAQQQGDAAESMAEIQDTGGERAQSNARAQGVDCGALRVLLGIALAVTVIAPALGGAFTTLADLYQWDRLTTIYDSALENLEVADARSPNPNIPPDDLLTYRAAMRAFAEGTLSVMRDETAQWGQSIRTPEQLDKFIRDERERLRRMSVPGQPEPDTGAGVGSAGAQAAGGTTGTSSASGDEPPPDKPRRGGPRRTP